LSIADVSQYRNRADKQQCAATYPAAQENTAAANGETMLTTIIRLSRRNLEIYIHTML